MLPCSDWFIWFGWPLWWGHLSLHWGFGAGNHVSRLVARGYIRVLLPTGGGTVFGHSSCGLLYLKRITSNLVGHSSCLEAGVLG